MAAGVDVGLLAGLAQEVGMPEALTPIERRIYGFLVDYLKRETYQPSIREIGSRFGIRSTKTVTEHLQSLQRKGYLDRAPSRSRALRILGLNLSPKTYTIPVYRNAGRKRSEEVDARYDLDRAFACAPDCFLVPVNGDHLRKAGILDGDMILVEPRADLQEGDLAVVERDGVVELHSTFSTEAPRSARGNSPGAGPLGNGAARLLGTARGVFRTLGARG